MTVLTETVRAGECVISLASGTRSRDAVTVLLGEDLAAGHVIGRVTIGAAVAAHVAGGTGNSTFSTIDVYSDALPGVYTLTCTAATKFTVTDPNGGLVGLLTLGTVFAGGGLSFTQTAGATPHEAGDLATITIAAGTGKVREWNPANTDGSQVAAGILIDAVDATSADADGVAITRDAEINSAELFHYSGATTATKALAARHLAAVGVLVR